MRLDLPARYNWMTITGTMRPIKPSHCLQRCQATANAKLKEFHAAAEKIDVACKALDTYHKLEDYKNDDFTKALTLISELQILVADYRKKQNALQLELESGIKN